MFMVDEPTAEAIRRAYFEGGELSGVVELRRHYSFLTDNTVAGSCVRAIAGWMPAAPEAAAPGPKKRRGRSRPARDRCEA